jgi:hypothetical protein
MNLLEDSRNQNAKEAFMLLVVTEPIRPEVFVEVELLAAGE